MNHSSRAAIDAQARTVARVIQPEATSDGAGVKLKRSIASQALNYLDPFLLFDHFGSENAEDYIAGFPMHPHRGIETVTYMLAGAVRHQDSAGNSGIIRAGDVQWMTAGGGIMHEEMPQLEGGRLDGFQLWVNLPARLKMTKPRYQEIPAHEIPTSAQENGIRIRIIAGRVGDISGAVKEIAADPSYLDVSLPANTSFAHPIPAGHTAFAYVFAGAGVFGITGSDDGQKVTAPHLVVFDDGDEVRITAAENGVRFLLISGKPLNEPIARYGPFVMNTEAEIEQALLDLRRGTFVK
ncbi:MAG TPA: pirin family protein [Pyrinomonadaceae bacterium]|nr:pirin family protein [Pyrinomonadaceae bacterium]